MNFVLESHNPAMKIETFLWKDLLDEKRGMHQYDECTFEDLPNYTQTHECHNRIPLGSINFTNRFLQLVHNIEQMNPVEIPVCLRTEQFLGRQYSIVPFDAIPTEGMYFIKDANAFKSYSLIGNKLLYTATNADAEHMYVVSEMMDVLAEYRVYIVRGEVYAIEYYNGDPLCLPDAAMIQKANLRYSCEKDYPGSYTIDVMVTKSGTFIIEVHPTLFSCGLYTTVLGTDFLYGYMDGLHYILNHNTPVTPT